MISQEAVYHVKCLVELYNKVERTKQIRSGTKSDLLSCLEKNGPAQAQRPSFEALLLDGATIVNICKP